MFITYSLNFFVEYYNKVIWPLLTKNTRMKEIDIKYERHVPKSIIQEFVKDAQIQAHLTYAGDVEHWDYAEGQIVADVTLILNNPIVQGVISNFFFAGLVLLIRKLSKLKEKSNEQKPCLQIIINNPTFNANLTIVEKLNDEQASACSKQTQNLIVSNELEKIAANPEYDSQEANKPTSSYKYHSDINFWLPYNFERETYWKDAERRAKNKLD
jgi:hypothetical protein